jgi:hypothetical protein
MVILCTYISMNFFVALPAEGVSRRAKVSSMKAKGIIGGGVVAFARKFILQVLPILYQDWQRYPGQVIKQPKGQRYAPVENLLSVSVRWITWPKKDVSVPGRNVPSFL